MGWSISVIRNTVEISPACAEALFEKLGPQLDLGDVDDLLYEGKLYFDPDHMEHMDYVSHVLAELAAPKVNGEIVFGSLQGDNRGRAWGYNFVDGVVTQHSGTLVPSWEAKAGKA